MAKGLFFVKITPRDNPRNKRQKTAKSPKSKAMEQSKPITTSRFS